MTTDGKLPNLRPLEIKPFQDEHGQLFFELRDMLQISPRPLVMSGAGYFVLVHLDGAHTVNDVQAVFLRETGQAISAAEVFRVVEVLEHYAMLETARFASLYAEQRNAYLAAPVRDSRDRWPPAETLRAEIGRFLPAARGEPDMDVRGIVAPHLDYARGAPCYAAGYGALLQAPPADRYVILGTNHFGRSPGAVATRKDFLTPLGLAPVDRAFLARLDKRLGADLCEHEFDHCSEHSVELQVMVLQVCQRGRPFKIVPILCPDACGPDAFASAPGNGCTLDRLADALAGLAAEDSRRTVLIAAADLSHVGRPFGDGDAATPESLGKVEELDRRLLARLAEGQESAAVADLRASQNATKICSTGCLYTLRRALRGRPWRTLEYHQALDPSTDTNVTCAAAVVL